MAPKVRPLASAPIALPLRSARRKKGGKSYAEIAGVYAHQAVERVHAHRARIGDEVHRLAPHQPSAVRTELRVRAKRRLTPNVNPADDARPRSDAAERDELFSSRRKPAATPIRHRLRAIASPPRSLRLGAAGRDDWCRRARTGWNRTD